MSEADKSKPSYALMMVIAGAIGIAFFCTVHALTDFSLHDLINLVTGRNTPKSIFDINYPPIWILTPLYIAPLLIGLLITRRIGSLGLIFLTFAVTGAHYLAQTLGAQIYVQLADMEPYEAVIFTLIGAIAGAIGSTVSFIAFAILGKDMRDSAHLKLYALSTLGLAVIGALGFLSMTLLQPASGKWILHLYLPWQLAFTIAIAKIFYSRKT